MWSIRGKGAGALVSIERHLLQGGGVSVRHLSRGKKELIRTTSIDSGVGKTNTSADLEEQDQENRKKIRQSLVGPNVHGSSNSKSQLSWRKRPLFSRAGRSVMFEYGAEAADLLVAEAQRRDPYQADFIQSMEEVAYDVATAIEEQPKLAWVFKQLMEPERLVTFRVPWKDDNGNVRLNRGYRIQYSSTLGPYRGGLRFHPHISHGSMRMLGWEQTLKNALTPWEFGGSKGGSDFDPSDKSDQEIRTFCECFVDAILPFIGNRVDAFESDLNVGAKEMGYMREYYYRTLTSSGAEDPDNDTQYLFGSTEAFPEGAGFGCAYFAERAIESHLERDMEGMRCLISGTGTMARSTALKLMEMGAVPLTLSDDSGFIYADKGLTKVDLEAVAQAKEKKVTLAELAYAGNPNIQFVAANEGSMWKKIPASIAFPCSSQGELIVDDAQALEENGCIAVFECADRGCAKNARVIFEDRNILFGPSKATNCGAIVSSGYYQQSIANEQRPPTKEELDLHLKSEMYKIHDKVSDFAVQYSVEGNVKPNLKAGANLASFMRIAERELPN